MISRVLLSVLVVVLLSSALGAETVAPPVKTSPLISPQPDGVAYLNAEAAAIIRWDGENTSLINGGDGKLSVLR